ncbi:hypothetical protein Scani_38610 [Streptomyces caniferus]|uniref:Response regulatory domain-containing protein n=1 Tax=Streptomyces caniferus TaxID=285557 RepID=A0A640S7Y4_9ACTN|nr:hypothetical protein Scani_38610 [Streptomyces caniferus]
MLVVEDEPPLVRALEINLKARGYDVDTAPDGSQALSLAAMSPPDVVLLGLGLPDMDDIDVITELRGWSRASILVVAARRTSDEKVAALDAGADDYITKPFSMDELLARLRAAARSSSCWRRCGGLPSAPRATTCASTRRSSGANRKPTRRVPGASSPCTVWATASTPDDPGFGP